MGGVADTPSTDDPGDDTARRYRYQYEMTASLLCSLLDDSSDQLEIYCEHHEDALIRDKCGRYCGVQIKTRESGLKLWCSDDEQMVSAFSNFARKDKAFPDAFVAFRIMTNHQFWRTTKNGKNIPHLLALAHEQETPPVKGILFKFIKAIAAKAAATAIDVLKTLKKTVVSDDGPKFKDSLTAIVDTLVSIHPPCAHATHPRVKSAAQALANAVSEASSLKHEQHVPRYFILAEAPEEELVRAVLEGKRFTRERVAEVLAGALADSSVLLGDDSISPPPAPSETSILKQKLDAGQLSVISVNSAIDCWTSAAHQYLQWASRLGDKEASRRLSHLKAIVLNEAAAAYESTKSSSTPFGAAMLEELRRRIITRLKGDTEFFGLDQEHLLGCAYILTENCKVWFSEPFEIARR
jgi:hypothetical protein